MWDVLRITLWTVVLGFGLGWMASSIQQSNNEQIAKDRKECLDNGGKYATKNRINPNPRENFCIEGK